MYSRINGLQLWRKIQEAGIPWTEDGTKILMANEQSGGIPVVLQALCQEAIDEIAKARNKIPRHLMINSIPPGIVSCIHTDIVLDNPERWHLPLRTNDDAFLWTEGIGFEFLIYNRWHRVNYSSRHAVGNFGRDERVHLIVDLV